MATVAGDIITIDVRSYDFGPLPEGATLPWGSVDCEFIVGDVERINGEICLTLIMPHGANPSQNVAFPAPVSVHSGPVPFPVDANEVKPLPEPEEMEEPEHD